MTDSQSPEQSRRRKLFFSLRLRILLVFFLIVALYALNDVRTREARTSWTKTLNIAIVLVSREGDPPVDPAAVTALDRRSPYLALRLEREMKKYRDAPTPFRFHVLGVVPVDKSAPDPQSDSWLDLARFSFDLKRWVSKIDTLGRVDSDSYDTRIYVNVRKPSMAGRTLVEGRSEQGGRVGVVEVEFDATMIDLTLTVVAHELMHTLGASDKYDADGRSMVPDGLADPARKPLFPQDFAEIMARNRPVSAFEEVVPDAIDEIGVGPLTALEIGWRK